MKNLTKVRSNQEGSPDKAAEQLNELEQGNGWLPRPVVLLLYMVSLLLMSAVAAIMIWPEMEMTVFDRPLVIEERLGVLRCPLAVTLDEDAALTATFTNDQDRDQTFRALARISYHSALVFDEIIYQVKLAPGERKVVRWALEPESAAFGRMILTRVHVSRRGSLPPEQRGCGVMVLKLPYFTGTQYVLGMTVGGLLTLAASGFVWLKERPPAQEATVRRLALLAAGVAGAMFAGLFDFWALGGLLLLFSALLAVSFTQY